MEILQHFPKESHPSIRKLMTFYRQNGHYHFPLTISRIILTGHKEQSVVSSATLESLKEDFTKKNKRHKELKDEVLTKLSPEQFDDFIKKIDTHGLKENRRRTLAYI